MIYMKRMAIIFSILTITATGILYSQTGEEKTVKPGEIKTFSDIEMVLIPSSGNMPQFYIGKYEVTQKQYESITGINPSECKGIVL